MSYVCGGEVAERSIASVLKTDVLQGTGGSNPSFSASLDRRSLEINGLRFFFEGHIRKSIRFREILRIFGGDLEILIGIVCLLVILFITTRKEGPN